MRVTIDLSDDQAEALKLQADREGLTLDAWLQRLAAQRAALPSTLRYRPKDTRPIWEVVTERMKNVPDEAFADLPEDGASEHDHYIYGWPKRNQ